MSMTRRKFLLWIGAFSTLSPPLHSQTRRAESEMYGLIGKIIAVPERREELSNILMQGIAGMPGCLSYIVSLDNSDANALWVTEVWESQASHLESLELDSVQEAIALGRPMIAGFGERFETTPIGGVGL